MISKLGRAGYSRIFLKGAKTKPDYAQVIFLCILYGGSCCGMAKARRKVL